MSGPPRRPPQRRVCSHCGLRVLVKDGFMEGWSEVYGAYVLHFGCVAGFRSKAAA